ncbi:PDZ and LIM domain protein 5b isoform X1 [Alosa sapidissima]|uniref:PDZ and LIM domain protein 5b isoform X1 n=1 Tax=Alosa sapidissima TaxID=34773 RepID=UPI001C0A246B|nr:PDZ and LIM domain protein 5b isoform X1 [Alosa sapidissima]
MSSSYSVSLIGPSPWGFRLQGGKDFCMPLTISKLTDGGKASKAKISVGDTVLSIDGISTDGMTHLEAQNKIKACTGNLNLTLQKGTSTPKAEAAPKTESQEILKPVPITHASVSPVPFSSGGSGRGSPANPAYNKTARPFGGGSAPSSGVSIPSASSAFTPHAQQQQQQQPPQQQPPPMRAFPAPSSSSSASSSASSSPARGAPPPSTNTGGGSGAPHSSVYNTPIQLYSNANACEVAMGQRRGLYEGKGGVELVNGTAKKPVLTAEQREAVAAPVVPAPDASKKRLMEDTEDWHPRTGTTQSRSFRILAQITGTENDQAPENSSAKNEVVEDIHSSAPLKSKVSSGGPRHGNGVAPPASKPWQSSSTAGLPKAGVQPSFGRVSGGGGGGVPKPAPARPAPQPHPMDQDSLVQRAEHVAAGTRTPMCAACNVVIRGPFLVAMGKAWHPEEFNCAHCRASLVEVGFVEERGNVYCEHCYEEFLAPTCARCQGKVLGEVINALKQTWHVSCFLCTSCQQPIRNNTFHLEDGQPYCEKDYYELFGTSCHGCDFPIEAGDKFLEALGFTWHDTCFVCAVCQTSLEGQAFFSKKDKPLCKKHAHTVKI